MCNFLHFLPISDFVGPSDVLQVAQVEDPIKADIRRRIAQMALIREQVPATTTAVPMLSGTGSVNSIHGMAGNEDAVPVSLESPLVIPNQVFISFFWLYFTL